MLNVGKDTTNPRFKIDQHTIEIAVQSKLVLATTAAAAAAAGAVVVVVVVVVAIMLK